MIGRRLLLGLCLLGAALPVVGTSVAHACGGFFRARTVSPEERPSLAREKVLIVFDAEKRRQHFIRELAFRQADATFGFVVPTPTRPEVESVAETPFTSLRNRFPFVRNALGTIGRGGGAGSGSGSGAGVEVLEEKKIGSFTVFVLAATDAKALAGWLATNELVSTPEADAWLAHYVAMGCFYTAIRFDPKGTAQRGPAGEIVQAETMRISFDTPLPYYPYLEPEDPRAPGGQPRLLELWYVGSDAVVPVALQEHEGETRWIRPFQEGEQANAARDALEAMLPADVQALLPAGDLQVQTFQDQKLRRTGFRDILFAHRDAHALGDDARAELEPLLAILDPKLVTP